MLLLLTPALPCHSLLPTRYMTDEHFWHVYFTLARKHLPDAAYSWGPEDLLPTFEGARLARLGGVAWQGGRRAEGDLGAVHNRRLQNARLRHLALRTFACRVMLLCPPLPLLGPPAEEAAGEAFSLTSLSSQLKQLGSKLQSASASGRQRAGLELSNLVSSVRGERGSPGPEAAAATSSRGAEAGGGAAGVAAGVAAAGAAGAASAAAAAGEAKVPPAGMLEEDPDLEAYLQVWWGTGACAGLPQEACY